MGYIGTIGAYDLIFKLNNSERSRITASGNVGIGTSAPTEKLDVNGNITATKVYGAVYNDYAEYRSSDELIDYGYVLIEDENGNVIKCNEDRSKKILGVSSDTLGFLIGKQEDTDTPIAAAGRVLVYLVDKHKLKIGDLVCSTKDGKVRKMKWWEKIFFPELIVGYVSEFPDYDIWGSDNIKVNGRIWIRI